VPEIEKPPVRVSKKTKRNASEKARQKAHAKQTLGNAIRAQASSIQHPTFSSQQPLRQSVSGEAGSGGASTTEESPGRGVWSIAVEQESWTKSSFRTSEITSDYVLLQIQIF